MPVDAKKIPSFDEVMGARQKPSIPSFDEVMSQKKNQESGGGQDGGKPPAPSTSPSVSQEDTNGSVFDLNFPMVTTNDGVSFSVSKGVSGNLVETPKLTPQAIKDLQYRVSTKTATPEDVAALAEANNKSKDVTEAYIRKGKLFGGSVENNENVANINTKLEDYIKRYNAVNGTTYDPQDILSTSDKTFDFLQTAKTTKAVPPSEIDPNRAVASSTAVARQERPVSQLFQEADTLQELLNRAVDKKVDEQMEAGVSKDKTIAAIAKLTNPKDFAKSQKQQHSVDYSDVSATNPATAIGALLRDNESEDELFNYQKGFAELKYNEALKRNAVYKISTGVVNDDKELVSKGRSELAQVDDNVVFKYPALIKQQIAQQVNDEIAKRSGVVQGYETQDGHHLERVFGSSTNDRIDAMQKLGLLDDPRTKDIALSMAGNSTYFANNSIAGSAVPSALQPLADLGMSLADIAGARSGKDIYADKLKDEIFQHDFSQNKEGGQGLVLRDDVRFLRTAVNTTANLAGMIAISAATEGLATGLGAAKTAAQAYGAYTSFGLPSFDGALKESKGFLDSEPAQYLYAGITAVANAEGGRLLDMGKIARGALGQETIATLADRLTKKNITEDATRELLAGSKEKFIDFSMKYGKNITKGAATMAYFTTVNNVVKLAFGDPNTKAEDILPQAGHAFLDGLVGMGIMGGFGAASDMRSEKNTSYKGAIYNMALHHDAAKDVLDMGLKDGAYDKASYDNKIAILNTAKVAKVSLDAAQAETGVKLSQEQKAVYVANKTAESFLREKANNTELPEEKAKYESQADQLKKQSTATLDGLKFTSTLEPLYDLYSAEKEYNTAQDNYKPTDLASADALEAAKTKYDGLYSKYLADVPDSLSPIQVIEANRARELADNKRFVELFPDLGTGQDLEKDINAKYDAQQAKLKQELDAKARGIKPVEPKPDVLNEQIETDYRKSIHDASQGELKLDLLSNEKIVELSKDSNDARRNVADHKRIKGKLDILNELIKCN